MKTIKITKADLDKDNKYKQGNIGTFYKHEDASVEIDENLGYVEFDRGIYVSGSVVAKSGSGIKSGLGIEAGSGIKSGLGIEAGWGIKSGLGIEAGGSIEAGDGIKAGGSIEAGDGIKAGWGIVSLYSSIKAKLGITVDARCTIAAGIFAFSGAQDVEAQEINGNVIYGNMKLLPKEEKVETSQTNDEIVLNGVRYKKV